MCLTAEVAILGGKKEKRIFSVSLAVVVFDGGFGGEGIL